MLSYNGEIYNAPELRAELEAAGRSFRGSSDTEVLVEAVRSGALKKTVRRLIGMFAFAAWDRADQSLYLVRDRLGIKPVYWGKTNSRLIFASELKAFRSVPDWRGELDLESLSAYLRYSYVPAPRSIFRNVQKLQPGMILQGFATMAMCARRPIGRWRMSRPKGRAIRANIPILRRLRRWMPFSATPSNGVLSPMCR